MNEKLNILLLGNGGREAAIARSIAASPRTQCLHTAPGNAAPYGINVDLNPTDFDAIEAFVSDRNIDMIVVGPEQPLVEGIADRFADSDIKVIGPGAEGARLEGSKEFAKEFMFRHGIPTARFMTVTTDTLEEGLSFLESMKAPYVLKADGLAAGKGVLIIDDLDEAKRALNDMLAGMFGAASETVVIEQFLDGRECSVFVATDGDNYHILPVAKDYKRIGEGDTGLNTGGMGAVSPVDFADDEFMEKVEKRIVIPTIEGLKAEGISYKGFIFLGLIKVDGEPLVIEYNVRMGDPETEVVMPRISSDLVDLLEGIAEGTLAEKTLTVNPQAAVTVMLVSGGYPGSYAKGMVMSGFDRLADDIIPFAAGAVTNERGETVTSGGRVMALTAMGNDVLQAASKAKAAAETVGFEGKYYRRDIADDFK